MTLYKKIRYSSFLICGFFLQIGVQTIGEEIPKKEYQSELAHYESNQGDSYKEEQKERRGLLTTILDLSIKRVVSILFGCNPIIFVLDNISFLLMMLLGYFVMQNIEDSSGKKLKNFIFKFFGIKETKDLIRQIIYFYFLYSINAILSKGIFNPLLKRLRRFDIIYRFFYIILSTFFTALCIKQKWYFSLMTLIPISVIISFIISPKRKEDKDKDESKHLKNAYLCTNILFMIICWGFLRSVWYLLVKTDKLDKFSVNGGVAENEKEKKINNDLIDIGDIGLKLKLFFCIKNIVAPKGGSIDISLSELKDDAMACITKKSPINRIDGYYESLSSDNQEIGNAILRNLAFEFLLKGFL